MENKEKHIIERIRDHREVVDTSDLWSSIEGEIGAPEKKRRPILWFWFGAFILVAVGLVWQYQEQEITPLAQLSNDLEVATEKIGKKISTTIEEDNNTKNGKKSIEEIEQVKTNVKDQSIKTKMDNQVKTPLESRDQIENPLLRKKSSRRSQIKTNDFEVEKIMELGTEKILNQTKSVSNEAAILVPMNTNPEIELAPEIEENKDNLIYDIPFLELIMPKVDYQNEEISSPSLSIIPIVNEEEELTSKSWAVGIAGGYIHTSRNLAALSTDLEEQRLYRENIEKSIGGLDISASLTYRYGKMRIGSGISYTSLIDLAEFQSSNIRQKEGDETTIHYLDGSINTVPTQNFIEETWRHKRYNSARFVSIPLNISYQFLSVGNIDFSLGIEGRYNISFGYIGLTGETTVDLYDLNTDVDSRYKKSGVHQYGLNLAAEYPFSSTTTAMFNIGYAKTNRINTENYLIDQQYNLINLTAGIQWLF